MTPDEQSRMNVVRLEQAMEMLGEDRVQELRDFRRLLTGQAGTVWEARLAPSIVTRSEVEVFGVSMPRFALRFYLDQEGHSFVNARRLQTLMRQHLQFKDRRLEPGEPGRDSNLEMLAKQTWPTPESKFERCSCIADGYLSKPNWLGEFDVLAAKLSDAYGEHVEEGKKPWLGTPYMMHIPLAGGGLCAQACCFMATALRHEDANGVYGLAEVTFLAQGRAFPQDVSRELHITGLNNFELQNYFKAVGLRGEWQRVWKLARRPDGGPDYFNDVLRAYVTSGMSVVLPIDLARACGLFRPGSEAVEKCLFAKNVPGAGVLPLLSVEHDPGKRYSTPPTADMKAEKENRHAVLIVGYDRESDLFCYQDPALRPFMVGSAGDFRKAAVYCADRENSTTLLDGMFLPVTPRAVQLQLGWWQDSTDLSFLAKEDCGKGLLWIADLLAAQSVWYRREGCYFPSDDAPADRFKHFRLMQVKELVEGGGRILVRGLYDFDYTRRDLLKPALKLLREKLTGFLSNGDQHWLWVQFLKSGVVVWDAELPMPKDPDRYDPWGTHLRAVLNWEAGVRWREVCYFLTQPLQLSCITSCSVCSTEETANALEEAKVTNLELYAFMQDEAEDLFKGTRGEKVTTAVAKMAECSSKPDDVAKVAGAICDRLIDSQKVIGFATFIPEIASSGPDGALATDALKFLVQLASEMQHLGHPATVIEAVAGSLMDGVWPAKELGSASLDLTFGANVLSPIAGIGRLVDRLRPVAKESQRCFAQKQDAPKIQRPIGVALELEPGPLFVLGDLEKVDFLCKSLDADRELSPIVGLNLDVPHWGLLARISVDEIRARPAVFNRIIHAHISDHGCGHFGDNPPNAIHGKEFFDPWIHLLTERCSQSARLSSPAFSGYVSLELEACKHRSVVKWAVKEAQKLGLGL
jgi:hypothetical protein